MTKAFHVQDLGRMSYEKALAIQEERFNRILTLKREGRTHDESTLFLVEHDPVYTLGKSGDPENLIHNPTEVGATFFRTTRGGDITYHGPGQIVGYPVFDLEQFGMGLAKYIHSIEDAIINTIAEYGLQGGRIEEASGVWLDADTPRVRKICAIGVKASRYVTMHGFAFNVNTDLGFFGHIIPCGITDKGVTSMQQELGRKMDIDEVKQRVVGAFYNVFQRAEVNS